MRPPRPGDPIFRVLDVLPANRTELSQERRFSRIQARDRPQGTSRAHLVNEVANVREDAVTQFHAPKTGTEWGVQVLFKTLEDVSG